MAETIAVVVCLGLMAVTLGAPLVLWWGEITGGRKPPADAPRWR